MVDKDKGILHNKQDMANKDILHNKQDIANKDILHNNQDMLNKEVMDSKECQHLAKLFRYLKLILLYYPKK